MTLGGNDAYMNVDTRSIQQNIHEIVKICKKSIDHIIWGCGIPESFPCDEVYRQDFANMMKEVARKEKITVVELPREITRKENIAEDRIHFKEGPVLEMLAKFAFATAHPMVQQIAKERREALRAAYLPYYQAGRPESKEHKENKEQKEHKEKRESKASGNTLSFSHPML
jgi:hypothetical protein